MGLILLNKKLVQVRDFKEIYELTQEGQCWWKNISDWEDIVKDPPPFPTHGPLNISKRVIEFRQAVGNFITRDTRPYMCLAYRDGIMLARREGCRKVRSYFTNDDAWYFMEEQL